jgi:hypothetical protein
VSLPIQLPSIRKADHLSRVRVFLAMGLHRPRLVQPRTASISTRGTRPLVPSTTFQPS